MRLPLGAALAGDIFQRKMAEIFKELPNVFGMADDILVASYNNDAPIMTRMLQQVLHIFREETSNLMKRKAIFKFYQYSLLWRTYF